MSISNITGNGAVARSSDGSAVWQSGKINEEGTCSTHLGGAFSEQLVAGCSFKFKDINEQYYVYKYMAKISQEKRKH